ILEAKKAISIKDSTISADGDYGLIVIGDYGKHLLVYINKSELKARSQNQAGSIYIIAGNLLLRNNSLISVTANSSKVTSETSPSPSQQQDSIMASEINENDKNKETRVQAGDIYIQTNGFVIAVPSENSDILANASGGDGGTIDIDSNRILGFQNRGKFNLNDLRTNRISDINAKSDGGSDGKVSLKTLSIDPIQDLVALPTDLVDPSGLIAQGCDSGKGRVAKGQSEFVITGRGGLPPSPDDTLSAGDVSSNWVNRPPDQLNHNAVKLPIKEAKVMEFSSGGYTPLVEAVGMVRNSNGEIVLTAQSPTATPLQSGLSSKFCFGYSNIR
ncbi:MAG: S-layer family protein, partial [Rhizonema sp. PD38]|nr:S-layer family protein [Rhizonema sp. PD38]